MTKHIQVAALLCAAVLSACKIFDENAVRDLDGDLATSRVKFHNFAVGSVGVNFFANDVKMTAISSAACSPTPAPADTLLCTTTGKEAATGVGYGSLAAGEYYASIAPGQYTLASKKAATDSVVSTVSQTIADTKYYSFFMSGIYNTTTKTAEAFVVEDPIPASLDYTMGHMRIVNAISNSPADAELFAKNTTTLTEVSIGTAAYKAAGAFVALPEGTYDLRVRYVGASSDRIVRTAVSVVGGRVYTVTARGDNTVTSTTLSTRPLMDYSQNWR